MGIESEYQRYEEPYSYEVRDRRVRGARGLQAADGLTTSAVFDDAAERYVAGDINARQLSDIVDDYYNQKVERGINRYSQEADLVSARICDALDSNGFTFSPATLRAIHGRLSVPLQRTHPAAGGESSTTWVNRLRGPTRLTLFYAISHWPSVKIDLRAFPLPSANTAQRWASTVNCRYRKKPPGRPGGRKGAGAGRGAPARDCSEVGEPRFRRPS